MLNMFADTDLIQFSIFFVIIFFSSLIVRRIIIELPNKLENDWVNECREFLNIHNDKNIKASQYQFYFKGRCSHCFKFFSFWQYLPIISFFYRRCIKCKKKINIQIFIIDFISIIFPIYFLLTQGVNCKTLIICILIWFLTMLSFIDINHHLLPDCLTLSLLWIGLMINTQALFTSLNDAVLGAFFGYLSLWGMFWIFKFILKKEGMGYGDFKFLSALGAWFGWQALPILIFMSSFFGLLFGMVLIIFGKKSFKEPIPFGPFIASSGVAILFLNHWFDDVFFSTQWYGL